jgi:ABC-2 type transport system permease protein
MNLYLRLLRVQYRAQLQYRASFVFQLIGAGLVTVTEFASLAFVMVQFNGIGGWTVGEVAFLYGLVEIAFGAMDMIFSGFDPARFGQEVRKGTFDQIMLRPIPLLTQVLGSDFALRRIGKIVLGGAIFGLSLALTGIAWTPVKGALAALSVISMIFFFGGLFIIGAAVTFWTVESIEILNIVTYGGAFTLSHPMHVYPGWIRGFFTFVLPGIFLNYYPALYILGKPDPLGFPAFAPFLAPAAGLGVFAAALAFWRFGVRHYQSTGT